MGNVVVIKSGQARRIDPKTGADKGSVGSSNVRAAASDSDYIVIVYNNGQARRYDANTGVDKGSVGSSNAVGCGIPGGIIIINYTNGQSVGMTQEQAQIKGLYKAGITERFTGCGIAGTPLSAEESRIHI